jgi:lambda family phage portal protein
MAAAVATRSRLYDRYTALVAGALSLLLPGVAGRFRFNRELYREYTAGNISGPDQNFRPRQRSSADSDVKRGWALTAARCRDQYQNNSLIKGAVRRVVRNVVRNGIYPQFQFRDRTGKLDRQANTAWEALFWRWSRYCDATGKSGYGALQRLGLNHVWFDGGFLIRRVYDDSLPNIVPLRLEFLELSMLDHLIDGVLPSGNIARRGIEFSPAGKEVAFHILEQHPGDYIPRGNFKSRRIAATEIIHVWDREMISQYSGMPWLHAVVMEGYRMDEFRHITQDTARAQAIFAYFLKSSMPGFSFGPGIPAGGQTAPFTPGQTGGTLDTALQLNSTSVQKLPQGTEVQSIAPSHPGNNYEPFVKDSQRWQSAGIGMSFEAFANNYTDASYASARSGSLEERLSYQGQQNFVEEEMNSRLVGWFIEAAWLAGLNPSPLPGYRRDPLSYHEQAEGQMPGWTWVDPANDAAAAEKLIELVIDTRTSQAAQRGQVFEDIVERQMEEEDKLIALYEKRNKRLALATPNPQEPADDQTDAN